MSESDRKEHYTKHFINDMELILQNIAQGSDHIVCPMCQVKILRETNSMEDFKLMAFKHIGFVHDLIPKLFLTDNNIGIEAKPLAGVKSSLSDRLWAIKAGLCLVCQEDMSPLDSPKRIEHYFAHFTTLHETMSTLQCYKCNSVSLDIDSYKLHLLNKHLKVQIKHNIRLTKDNEFQCSQCTFRSSDVDVLVSHIVNEELLLDVEIMIDLEEATEQKEKHINCKLCNKFIKPGEIFVKHLYQKHFKRKVINMVLDYFDGMEGNEAITCKKCGKEVKEKEAGFHVASAHKKVLELYAKYGTKEEDKQESDIQEQEEDNCTELTTLGEETTGAEEIESKMKKFLATKKKSQDTFIQHAPCYMFNHKLPPCHECKKIQQGASYALSGTCCCFEGFRKVRYSEDGSLLVVGYLDPNKDPRAADIAIWAPKPEQLPENLSEDDAVFILKKVGDLLCDILVDEKQMKVDFEATNRCVVWKRAHPVGCPIKNLISHFQINPL